MPRYIDADKLAEYITTNHCKNCDIYDGEKGLACGMNDALNFIETFETADVAEVVRCKDCKYKTVTSDGEYNPEDIVCGYFMSDGFRETDFCSYGERKE